MPIFACGSLLIARHLLTSRSGSEDLGLILENFKVTSGVDNPSRHWMGSSSMVASSDCRAGDQVRANPWLNGVASRRKVLVLRLLATSQAKPKKCKYPYHLVIIRPCKHRE